jgi:SAM-dependent methyltransferase
MLMRKTAVESLADDMNEINDTVINAVVDGDERLARWHVTRVWEYPWAMKHCPPVGNVLDIGSDPKWFVNLVAKGHKVVAHHTYHDTAVRGRIHPWEPDGGISLEKFYREHKHQTLGVLGLLEDLNFIRDEYFDTIYCLSVIEHVQRDEINGLLSNLVSLLRPGGKLCITADWFTEFGVGGGVEGYVVNYDLDALSHVLKPVTPLDEVPWHHNFNRQKLFSDPDVVCTMWGERFMVVYGVVFEK